MTAKKKAPAAPGKKAPEAPKKKAPEAPGKKAPEAPKKKAPEAPGKKETVSYMIFKWNLIVNTSELFFLNDEMKILLHTDLQEQQIINLIENSAIGLVDESDMKELLNQSDESDLLINAETSLFYTLIK